MFDKPHYSDSPYDIGGIGLAPPSRGEQKSDADVFHSLLNEEIGRTEVLINTLLSRLAVYSTPESKSVVDAPSTPFASAYFHSLAGQVESLARYNIALADLIRRLAI